MNWKFKIRYDSVETDLSPHFSELNFSQEIDEDFGYLRTKLNSEILLIGADYVLISSFSITKPFIVDVYKQDSNNDYILFYSAKCFKNKGEFDDDKRTISLKLDEVIDQYTDFLAGFDKKVNILDLPLNTKILNLKKRGILQIYIAGSSFVTNYLGGNYWATDAINPTSNDSTLTNTYNFVEGNEMAVMGAAYGGLSTISYGNFTDDLTGSGSYKNYSGFVNGEAATLTYELSVNLIRWTVKIGGVTTFQSAFVSDTLSLNEIVLSRTTGSVENVIFSTFNPYLRMLTDNSSISGTASVALPETDLVSAVNFNYTWSYASNLANLSIQASMQPSINETDWGIISDSDVNGGDYRVKYDYFDGYTIPIDQTSWTWYSFWFYPTSSGVLGGLADSEFTINDNYSLGGAIISLLSEVDSGVTFEETTAYSDFLYNTINPVSLDANRLLLLTPNSNVIEGEYTRPATKGYTSLKALLTLLKESHNCTFYIDSDYRLRIEHIRFFNNNGNYTPTSNVYADLEAIVSKNTKQYAYFTNKYSYEKDKLLDEFNFEWGSSLSFIFGGYPVKSVGDFVERGLNEYNSVGNFMPDLDYLNSDSSNTNKDGFCLIGAYLVSGNTYEVPVLEKTINSATYFLQNGYLSNVYLHENYFLDNANSPDLLVNNEETTAESLKKIKVQDEVVFPCFNFNLPEPFDLISTKLGNGQPFNLTYDGVSNVIKTNLRYEFD